MTEMDLYSGSGGLLINVLSLLELAKLRPENRPSFRDWLYWLPFLVWPVAGIGLARAYAASGSNLSLLLALNVGLSAPLIIRAMASAVPQIPARAADGQ